MRKGGHYGGFPAGPGLSLSSRAALAGVDEKPSFSSVSCGMG